TRSATKNRSFAVAEPRMKLPCGNPRRRKTSTKAVAWMRSSADGVVSSEPRVSTKILADRLQKAACASESQPSSPNIASGRSQLMPQGPSSSSVDTRVDTESNEGRKQHQAQMMKPVRIAAVTALSDASRQKMAASSAGKNCAMAVKEM